MPGRICASSSPCTRGPFVCLCRGASNILSRSTRPRSEKSSDPAQSERQQSSGEIFSRAEGAVRSPEARSARREWAVLRGSGRLWLADGRVAGRYAQPGGCNEIRWLYDLGRVIPSGRSE